MVSSVCFTQLYGSLVAIPVAAEAVTFTGLNLPSTNQQWMSICDLKSASDCRAGARRTHVVRVQVVRDIRVDTCPCPESLELALGLRHVRVEEGKVANVGRSHLGVRVGRVVSLVAARGVSGESEWHSRRT
jgi:hypothetical protein